MSEGYKLFKTYYCGGVNEYMRHIRFMCAVREACTYEAVVALAAYGKASSIPVGAALSLKLVAYFNISEHELAKAGAPTRLPKHYRGINGRLLGADELERLKKIFDEAHEVVPFTQLDEERARNLSKERIYFSRGRRVFDRRRASPVAVCQSEALAKKIVEALLCMSL